MNNTLHFRRWFKLAATVPLALLAACAHTPRYAEPHLPPDQLAVLEVTVPVWLVSLDGQSVPASAFSDRVQVRVSPGRHRVEVSYRRLQTRSAPPPVLNGPVYNAREVSSYGHENTEVTTSSSHDLALSFVAKPGLTCGIDAGIAGNGWNPTIREVTPADAVISR